MNISYIIYIIILLPLINFIIISMFGTRFIFNFLKYKYINIITIISNLIIFLNSLVILFKTYNGLIYEKKIYTFLNILNLKIDFGILVDNLTAIMLCIITLISLIIHIYSIIYMKNDKSYNKFFSYISLFIFNMLSLVISNNLLQFFFFWELVGFSSYLLIGFWYYKKDTDNASFKAFIINRIGDIFFIISICLIIIYLKSLNFLFLLNKIQNFSTLLLFNYKLSTIICLFLFISAISKSAQFPMYLWLPDSMVGPTPTSALIHAATMVTSGIFLILRTSFLFEMSNNILSFILIIGSITVFLSGILAIIQNNIKKIIAYSTISQLGYMISALGVSAYSCSIFHLITHAFFKSLLFLSAGSIILNTKIKNIKYYTKNLYKYMPFTCLSFLISLFSLIGLPFFSGFYSKESIIESVYYSNLFGSKFAYYLLLISIFITYFYSFRMYFTIFHNFSKKNQKLKIKKTNKIIILSLLLLIIPAIFIGNFLISKLIFKDFFKNIFFIKKDHINNYHVYNPLTMILNHFNKIYFILEILIIFIVYFFHINKNFVINIKKKIILFYKIFKNDFFFNNLYIFCFKFLFYISKKLYILIDKLLIENLIKKIIFFIKFLSKVSLLWKNNYTYNYIYNIIISIIFLVTLFIILPLFIK